MDKRWPKPWSVTSRSVGLWPWSLSLPHFSEAVVVGLAVKLDQYQQFVNGIPTALGMIICSYALPQHVPRPFDGIGCAAVTM